MGSVCVGWGGGGGGAEGLEYLSFLDHFCQTKMALVTPTK